MAFKSRKALWEFLKQMQAGSGPKLSYFASSPEELINEVYGRDAMIYLDWKTVEDRKTGEGLLEDEGFKVHRNYWPGSPVSEVQVSYFKGLHWDE